MPSPTEQSAEWRSRARREMVGLLRITESTTRYACARLSNSAGPAEARATALYVAQQLEITAGALRRLALGQLDPAQCRAMAVELVEAGATQRRAAELVGRSRRTVRGWLASGSGHRARRARSPVLCGPDDTQPGDKPPLPPVGLGGGARTGQAPAGKEPPR